MDKFHDECAVVGVIGCPEASKYCYLSLYAMQHRGQEGAGIAAFDGNEVTTHREIGLVADIFTDEKLASLIGEQAIGHARYATFGGSDRRNIQPFVAEFSANSFGLAHNGNLINAKELREELEHQGSIFASTSDSEVILHLIARTDRKAPTTKRLASALKKVKGAYSLAVMNQDNLYAIRDPAGVRPLSIGRLGDGWIVASETCAFDLVGAEFVRDVEPGEIVELGRNGHFVSDTSLIDGKHAFCVFEYVYFARPDSSINKRNVYMARRNFGMELAKEAPIDADIVVPVPDSGVSAAIGYSAQSGIPLELGLIRNHYVGRTFIEPQQAIRDFGVKIKLNVNRDLLKGKSVVCVDDSIVRGTTCRKIVNMLKIAGAKEVHFRISSPPTIGPCYYGIDTPSYAELIGANKSVEEIKDYINADSLAYLSIEGIYRALERNREGYCDACFSGNYKLGIPES